MISEVALWLIFLFVLIVVTGLIGRRAKYLTGKVITQNNEEKLEEKDGLYLGILVDSRQRFSLTHLQSVLWGILFLSVLAALFTAGLLDKNIFVKDLSIKIPNEILILAGISAGSAVVATAAKSTKTEDVRTVTEEKMVYSTSLERDDILNERKVEIGDAEPSFSNSEVAAAAKKDPIKVNSPYKTRFSQIFWVEEGENIDKVVDVTKFQNFFLTIIVVLAYAFIVLKAMGAQGVLTEFPPIPESVLWLIAISNAGYVGGKIPNKP